MTTAQARAGMTPGETVFFRAVFVIAALWNFAGALPGLADPAGMFAREFGRELADPVMVAVYRGAWGTAFLYGFGFLWSRATSCATPASSRWAALASCCLR
ncbi:MAG: hypothetical protein KBA31_11855 [Alphaproteobacteria bacterium]|nr:hypothetical protein [Alphaproteobacteria bacterium]